MRYFVGFLLAIGLIIGVFILILRGFTHHSAVPQNQINLLDYTNSQTVVQLSVDGPVNADQNHEGYQITVGRDSSSIEVMQGYQGSVTQQKTYPNNAAAYGNFLRALQLFNFTKGNPSTALSDDRGVCPTGDRYVFSILSGGQTVQRYWTTSCGGGSFQGKSATIRNLFQQQIPDFNTLTQNLNL